jgi:hypothetical protein
MDRNYILKRITDSVNENELIEINKALALPDKEFALAVVNQNGSFLRYMPELIKADKDVVLAAVRKNGFALEWASAALKADKEVVLAAVNNWGHSLEYASPELKKDRDVLMAAATKIGNKIYKYTSGIDEQLNADLLNVIRRLNAEWLNGRHGGSRRRKRRHSRKRRSRKI